MSAQERIGGINNPYIDDKLFHFGFSLGTNFMGFGVTDSNEAVYGGQILHARVSSLMPGFSVGFITDVRLCRYVNFRFTPTLHFSSRTISYVAESGAKVRGTGTNGSTISMLSLPIDIPVYFKFSAARVHNYRPYVIAGGGFQYNATLNESVLKLKGPDAFIAIGAGCDIYMRWFKLCPEIKYHLGFLDVLTPVEGDNAGAIDPFYTQAIKRLSNQMISVCFNFE